MAPVALGRASADSVVPMLERLDAPIKALVARGVATGAFRDDIEPHDLLRALAGVAHVRPSKDWKPSALRMADLLLKGMLRA